MKKEPVTIKQVAQEAGVSIMTVSRVINNPALVAEDTRKYVQEVVNRLGYRPNAIARSFKAQRTFTIGLITVDLTNSFFTRVSAGAEAEARRHGYRITINCTEWNRRSERELVRLLNEQHVDGILLVRDAIQFEEDPLAGLRSTLAPIVTTGYKHPGIPFTTIDVDNIDGGFQAASHLLNNGHRRIAMITGPQNHKSALQRMQGFMNAFSAVGGSDDPELIENCNDWQPQTGYQAAMRLLKKGKPFTAIFVHNDELALGVLRALRDSGLRVPQDVSLVGYDDLPIAEYLDPPLTTIRQPIWEIGVRAVDELIRQIDEQREAGGDVYLKTELIQRQSVKPIVSENLVNDPSYTVQENGRR